ncbi:MAG: lysoplasmalogenase [Parvibaculum sp.]|uniref:lysoplasmalogenase n=1 Tax=Parvibaculum sp. TaxID=2024848 RepID=UPI003C721B8A
MLNAALTFGDELDTIRWALAALSAIASLGYLAVVATPAGPLRTSLKTISIAALAPLPLLSLGHENAPTFALVCLTAALALGSTGDYFLALKGDTKNFQRGLIAFLIGHFFYLAVMLPRVSEPDGAQIAGMVALIALSIGTLLWLKPKLGSYLPPVVAYMGVITLMALAAFALPAPLAGLGALLFVFSDAVIAVDKFRQPVPFRGPIIWVTYYAGQVLIAASLLAMLG